MRTNRSIRSSRTAVSLGNFIPVCLVLVAGLFLSACQQKTAGVSGTDATGIYTLLSVDGAEVPADVSHGDVPVRVVSGVFTISVDGTCSSKVVFGPPEGDEMIREVNATYTQEGPKLTMEWEGAGTTEGTVEGDSFTMNNEGMIFAYKKEAAVPATR